MFRWIDNRALLQHNKIDFTDKLEVLFEKKQ